MKEGKHRLLLAGIEEARHQPFLLNPFRTTVPLWGQTTQISSSLPPKRDCGSKGVKGARNISRFLSKKPRAVLNIRCTTTKTTAATATTTTTTATTKPELCLAWRRTAKTRGSCSRQKKLKKHSTHEEKKKKNLREDGVVPERVPVPQVLEPLGCLHETHVRPFVVLAGPPVELEEVRHSPLQELCLEAVSSVVDDHDARGLADDRVLPGGVREDGGVHVSGLRAHLCIPFFF